MSNANVAKLLAEAKKWNGIGNINNSIDNLIAAVAALNNGGSDRLVTKVAVDETHEPSEWPRVEANPAVAALKREFEALGREEEREVSIPTPVTAKPETVTPAIAETVKIVEVDAEPSEPVAKAADPVVVVEETEEAKDAEKTAPKKPKGK